MDGKEEQGGKRRPTHKHDIEFSMFLFVGIKCFEPVRGSRMLELKFPHCGDQKLEIYLVVFY